MPDFEYPAQEAQQPDYEPQRDFTPPSEPVAEEPIADTGETEEEESSNQLTFEEGRVLGCLIEKSKTTPDNYPLSLNSLQLAANQKSNRFPVTDLDEEDIEDAIDGLREKKLAFRVDQAGARTAKFSHNAKSTLEFYEEHLAILSVLLLRGPQTVGEIRGRTERLYRFADVADVEEVLEEMMEKEDPIIVELPPSSGKTVKRFHQTLADYPFEIQEAGATSSISHSAPLKINKASAEQVEALEARIDQLEKEIEEMKSQFAEIRELLD
jgi:uncharacterized protein YceH (UPF0502 family)